MTFSPRPSPPSPSPSPPSVRPTPQAKKKRLREGEKGKRRKERSEYSADKKDLSKAHTKNSHTKYKKKPLACIRVGEREKKERKKEEKRRDTPFFPHLSTVRLAHTPDQTKRIKRKSQPTK